MLKRSSWIGIVLSFVVLLTLVYIAGAQSQTPSKIIKWQCALTTTSPGAVHQFYNEIEIPRRVKEATGGTLEIIPHKDLVKEPDIIDAVRDRRVDMGIMGSMYRAEMALSNYVAFPVILPYEALPKIHIKVEPLLQNWFRTAFDVEMLGIGYWGRQLLIAKRPANNFAELKGLKFRTHSYELLLLIKGAGGAPVSMPFPEVYLALQRGAIDGAVSSFIGFESVRWYEVSKYINWWPMGNAVHYFIVNKDSWNMLSANMQKAVRETVSKTGLETWKENDQQDKKLADKFLKEYGCTHLYPPNAEINKLGDMMGPIIADWKKRAGPRNSEVMAIINDVLSTKY